MQAQEPQWPVLTLTNAETITLQSRGRFDASALWRTRAGEWLTVDNREPILYQLSLPDGKLTALKQLSKAARYDCEGIAEDTEGRIYICEEAQRLILRWDRKRDRIERLAIDWSAATNHFSTDRNASFEGIAIGGDKLYVANERMFPRILVVDLPTLKLVDDFLVEPRTFNLLGVHYSDLCWHDGKLYVLCRQNQVVLQVDPETKNVLAEFDFKRLEDRLAYRKQLPVGYMEGLFVDAEAIWLLIDNNGAMRKGDDIRPVLLKCRR